MDNANLRKQTGLEWNLECVYSILNNTPLHRSEATSGDDLILAWNLLGDFTHVMFFPRTHLNERFGTRGILDKELQKRAPSLAGWAGPGFEQTCSQALFVLQSSTAGVASLPGEKLFMAQYMPGVACFKDHYFVTGFATPSTSLCILRVTIRQAYAEEALFGSCQNFNSDFSSPAAISFVTDNSRVET